MCALCVCCEYRDAFIDLELCDSDYVVSTAEIQNWNQHRSIWPDEEHHISVALAFFDFIYWCIQNHPKESVHYCECSQTAYYVLSAWHACSSMFIYFELNTHLLVLSTFGSMQSFMGRRTQSANIFHSFHCKTSAFSCKYLFGLMCSMVTALTV